MWQHDAPRLAPLVLLGAVLGFDFTSRKDGWWLDDVQGQWPSNDSDADTASALSGPSARVQFLAKEVFVSLFHLHHAYPECEESASTLESGKRMFHLQRNVDLAF